MTRCNHNWPMGKMGESMGKTIGKPWENAGLASGKLSHSYGKSPYLMGKSAIHGHVQKLFVCLPEGTDLAAGKKWAYQRACRDAATQNTGKTHTLGGVIRWQASNYFELWSVGSCRISSWDHWYFICIFKTNMVHMASMYMHIHAYTWNCYKIRCMYIYIYPHNCMVKIWEHHSPWSPIRKVGRSFRFETGWFVDPLLKAASASWIIFNGKFNGENSSKSTLTFLQQNIVDPLRGYMMKYSWYALDPSQRQISWRSAYQLCFDQRWLM